MANKSGQRKKSRSKNQRAADEQRALERRGAILRSALGLILAAYLTWRLEPSLGLGRALLIAVGIGLAWIAFILGAYYISNRNR